MGEYIPGDGGTLGSPMNTTSQHYLLIRRSFLQLVLRDTDCEDAILLQLLTDALAVRRTLKEQRAA